MTALSDGMTDETKVRLITKILDTHFANVDDDNGDKHLSDSRIALDAVDLIAGEGNPEGALRDGFITTEDLERR